MPKNKISEFSSTPANNTDIGGIDIAEGCAPSGINNAIRELMAQLKDQQAGTDADNFTVGGNLIVTGTSTLTTDLAITDGGTGASTASNARTNLGLGTISTQNENAVAITGGAISIPSVISTAGSQQYNNDGSGYGARLYPSSSGTQSIIQWVNFAGNSQWTSLVGTDGVLACSTPFSAASFSGAGTGLTGTAASLNAGIGVNQSYSNVTASRALSQTYTNNTGKPIFVSVLCGGNTTLKAFVNGVEIQRCVFTTTNTNTNVAFIVPNGSTYSITSTVAGIILWTELS